MSHAVLCTADLIDLQERWQLGVEYQPLVCSRSGRTRAFEALARFRADGRSLSPLQVFEGLHACPLSLFRTELAVTRLQLQRRPAGQRLFVNLDPHAADAYGRLDGANPLLALLLAADALVVELIENSSIADAAISGRLMTLFQRAARPLAIDDLGAPDSLLSLPLLMGVDYVKFDRCWLVERHHPAGLALLRSLLEFAGAAGKLTVLEGVESVDQLEFARELGFDWVQGFLFRERFVQAWAACGESALAAG